MIQRNSLSWFSETMPQGKRWTLWHRHRMVQARTRIMNQLQAVALNEGLRCKKRLLRAPAVFSGHRLQRFFVQTQIRHAAVEPV